MGIRKSLKKPAPKTKTRAKASARKRPTKSNGKPVGLDLGTSTVVAARQNGRGVRSQAELNAFIELPRSKFTEQILDQNEIDFVREGRPSLLQRSRSASERAVEPRVPRSFDEADARQHGLRSQAYQ